MEDLTPEGGNIETPLVKSGISDPSSNEIGADFAPESDEDNR